MNADQAPPQLHHAYGSDGQIVSFGKLQCEWLESEGKLKLAEEQTDPRVCVYISDDLTAMELHLHVWGNPDMRECDFCRNMNAPWLINCRPFKVMLAGNEAPLGGPDRPLVACGECAPLIRDNKKAELREQAITRVIESARRGGGYLQTVVRSHSLITLRAQIRPQVQGVIDGMFANRIGYPEKETP